MAQTAKSVGSELTKLSSNAPAVERLEFGQEEKAMTDLIPYIELAAAKLITYILVIRRLQTPKGGARSRADVVALWGHLRLGTKSGAKLTALSAAQNMLGLSPLYLTPR